jgi:hypothetical protein
VVHLQVAWHANIKCVINFNVYLQVGKSPWEFGLCMSLAIDIHSWPNLSKSIMVQLPSKRKCGREREKKRLRWGPLIYWSMINLVTIHAFYDSWHAIPSSSQYFSTLHNKLFLCTIVLLKCHKFKLFCCIHFWTPHDRRNLHLCYPPSIGKCNSWFLFLT